MLDRLSRWAAASGILAIALFVVAVALTSGPPDAKKSDAKIVAWVTDSGHQTKMFVRAAFTALAGAAFIWFFGALRAALREHEGGEGRLSATAFGAGLVLVALLYVGMIMSLVVPATASYTSKYLVAAAVLVAATAVISLRTAVFPR